ncbi:LANO_0H17876g1_1 [Lachancea nothofagi CBS 11611]|uniref:LANO_0H17876g1_1 n=1 Tax=Lachancea nothofagi CBS 11611 TaxID=1266666 RepID=A0A1G4KN94_9SACH|nr:LANO_0H17876g1_1 [Lachancea nothofagi CBS 11611]
MKGFLPHLRVLPEELERNHSDVSLSSVDIHEEVSQSAKKDEETKTEALENESQEPQSLQSGIPYELRDEKGRKWWKYFDEFEYRANSEYKKSRNWYTFLYPNHTTQTKSERRLLYKLDLMIGVYFLMLCWCKSLDTSNYSNAYFSGMQKELNMTKNDYINTVAISNVGAIVLQLPFMYILPRFPAHLILPIMDLGWSFFTFACYRAHSLAELRAYRFMVSAFGSAYYPVSQYVLGSWYAPDEISSRVCLFFCGQLLGGVTSGLLQARTYKDLNGVHGISGWRWMFLIDGIAISIPCAIIGFFVIPGIPSKCYSLFLSDEEIRVARARNRRNQINDGVAKNKLLPLLSWKIWKKIFFTPAFWVLVVFDTCSWNNMTAFSGSFLFWLQNDHNYSVVTINNLSVLPACLGFVFVFLCAWGADLFRCKWVFMVFSQIMNCVSCAILIKWDVANSTKWFAFLITYFSVAASPCLWSFINDFLRLDPQLRAVTWIAIYSFSQSTYAWIPTLAWKTVEQPRFKTGYTVSLVFSAVYGLWTFVVLYFYKRNEKKNALGNGIILYNSDNGEAAPAFIETQMEKKGEYYYVKDKENEASYKNDF